MIPLILLISLLAPYTSAFAAVYFTNFYSPNRDEYRFGYKKPEGADMLRLEFTSATGTYYEVDYTGVTGIMYLTCNGTYNAKFFNGTTLLDQTGSFVTTQIENPTCQSYSDGGAKNDLNIRQSVNEYGETVLDWDEIPGAATYEVWKDGVKVEEPSATTHNAGTDGGAYTVSAKDEYGNILGESDINIEASSSTGTDPTTPSCDGCQFLKDMLACPDWDQYMGELTQAIEDALPPPPDWDSVADKIGNSVISKLDAYMGEVPAAPTVNEINNNTQTDLPGIDSSAPDAQNVVPQLPSEFDQEQEFDLSEAPVIEVEDESRPFIITDPADIIDSSGQNVPVFPGDSVNHSGDIDNPAATEGDIPVPEATTSPVIVPAPTVTMPEPSSPVSSIPMPEGSTGTIPIPSTTP